MENKNCCVTGHRDIPAGQNSYVREMLQKEIERAVQDGYTGFMTGLENGVARAFAEVVITLQKDKPELRLIAVIPYQKHLDDLKAKKRTRILLDACTEVVVIQEKYEPNIYSRRSRDMVKHSDRVIAIYDGREKGRTVRMIRFTHMLRKELREIPVGKIVRPK